MTAKKISFEKTPSTLHQGDGKDGLEAFQEMARTHPSHWLKDRKGLTPMKDFTLRREAQSTLSCRAAQGDISPNLAIQRDTTSAMKESGYC